MLQHINDCYSIIMKFFSVKRKVKAVLLFSFFCLSLILVMLGQTVRNSHLAALSQNEQHSQAILEFLLPLLGPKRITYRTSDDIDNNSLLILNSKKQFCDNLRYNGAAVLRNGRWHVTRDLGMVDLGHSTMNSTTHPRELSIYGAYLDDRIEDTEPSNWKFNGKRVKDAPLLIRIFGVSDSQYNDTVYCHLWYRDINDAAIVVHAMVKDTGRGYPVNGRYHQERMYTCELPTFDVPDHVAISFYRCDPTAPLILITVPTTGTTVPHSGSRRSQQRHQLGICVAVAYGSLDALRLVEWFEFNQLIGVSEFNVYASRVNSTMRAIFQSYVSSSNGGVLSLFDVGPPVDNCWSKWCQKLSTIPILNDCMYRNMYRYEYMIVIDFDEFIMPQRHGTLTNLVQKLVGRSTKAGRRTPSSFLLRNMYFFTDMPIAQPLNFTIGDTQSDTSAVYSKNEQSGYNVQLDSTPNISLVIQKLARRLVTLAYERRINVSDVSHAPKSIVNPRYCITIQNHHCVHRVANAPGAVLVETNLATMHHYKNCSETLYGTARCNELMQSQTVDKSASFCSDSLLKRVQSTIRKFNILIPD